MKDKEAGWDGAEPSTRGEVGQEVHRIPRGWGKGWGVDAEHIRNLLENSEQRSDTIRFLFYKGKPCLLGRGQTGGEGRGAE